MADFSLLLKSDWTDEKRLERTLRAIESLEPQDSLAIEEAVESASEGRVERVDAQKRFANVLQLIQETFGKRLLVSSVSGRKATVQLTSQGGCCGVCGGGGHK